MSRFADDIIEIQQQLATYVFAIDAKDIDALDAVFTHDAMFDYSVTGGEIGDYKKIKPWLKKALAGFPVTQHLIGMPLIKLDGDRATSRTMLFNPMQLEQPEGPHIFFVGATYVDEWVRTGKGWRINKRSEADRWIKDLPADFTPEKA